MGCLDSVPENSPEARARELEDTLHLGQFSGDHIKAAFFFKAKNGATTITGKNFDKGWTELCGKGINTTLGEDAKAARATAFATFKTIFACDADHDTQTKNDTYNYTGIMSVLFFCSSDDCGKKWQNIADFHFATNPACDSEKVAKKDFTAIVGGTVRQLVDYSYVMGSWPDGPAKKQADVVAKAQTGAEKKVAKLLKACFPKKKTTQTWTQISEAMDKESDKSEHNLSNVRGFREFFFDKKFALDDHLVKPAPAKKAKKEKKAKKKDDKDKSDSSVSGDEDADEKAKAKAAKKKKEAEETEVKKVKKAKEKPDEE